jgi:hypothetical protein
MSVFYLDLPIVFTRVVDDRFLASFGTKAVTTLSMRTSSFTLRERDRYKRTRVLLNVVTLLSVLFLILTAAIR